MLEDQLHALEPKRVFNYFFEISKIPRGSGNEIAIADYVCKFAKDHGLMYRRDMWNNVVIKKPAYSRYMQAPVVILQGHLDMVCEKSLESRHDFTKDGLKLRLCEDMLYATDTTLGADNGIFISYALAILESDTLVHPDLEVVFTTSEEVGHIGMQNLDVSDLCGRYLINLDSEEEGRLLVCSAGGIRAFLRAPLTYEQEPREFCAPLRICVGGLKGGHSGLDIHLGRGNANAILGCLIKTLSETHPMRIASFCGGVKNNAISRNAEAVVCLKAEHIADAVRCLEDTAQQIRSEFINSDEHLFVRVEGCADKSIKCLDASLSERFLRMISAIPTGVITWEEKSAQKVKTSCNLGVVCIEQGVITIETSLRSFCTKSKYQLLDRIIHSAKENRFAIDTQGDYPAWEYDSESILERYAKRVYEEKFGEEIQSISIHGGIECGYMIKKIPGLKAVSIGPNLYDVHSPNEHLDVASTQRVYEYLLALLSYMSELNNI